MDGKALIAAVLLVLLATAVCGCGGNAPKQVTITVLNKVILPDQVGAAHCHVGTDKGDFECLHPDEYHMLHENGTYVVTVENGYYVLSVNEEL
jgi:hypothetical protein